MWSFTFKGESSRDYGITVNRRAPRQSANMRTVLTEVDGQDGAYIEKVGYNTYTMSLEMTVLGKDNLLRISSWLKGKGEFTRSDIPGRALEVEHQSELEFVMISEGVYLCKTTFQVLRPHWYLVEDKWSRPRGENLIIDRWYGFHPLSTMGPEQKAPIEALDVSIGRNIVDTTGISKDKVLDESTGGLKSVARGQVTDFIPAEPLGFKLVASRRPGTTSEWDGTTKFDHLRIGYYDINKKMVKVTHLGTDTSPPFVDDIPPGARFFRFSASRESLPDIKVEYGEVPTEWTVPWETLPEKDKPVRYWPNTSFYIGKYDDDMYDIKLIGGGRGLKAGLIQGKSRTVGFYVENNGYGLTISDGVDSTNTVKVPNGFKGNVRMEVSDKSAVLTIWNSENQGGMLDVKVSNIAAVEGDFPEWIPPDSPVVINEGNTHAHPIIRLVKGGNTSVEGTINGVRFIYNFDEASYVDIDCYTQEVIGSDGHRKDRRLLIGYDFPKLFPGPNEVKYGLGTDIILFRRKDAWR